MGDVQSTQAGEAGSVLKVTWFHTEGKESDSQLALHEVILGFRTQQHSEAEDAHSLLTLTKRAEGTTSEPEGMLLLNRKQDFQLCAHRCSKHPDESRKQSHFAMVITSLQTRDYVKSSFSLQDFVVGIKM